MAAHVFDGSEPDLDFTPSRPIASSGGASAIPAGEAPMFASRPAVFDKVHERQRVGSGPLIGLAVGAVIVGGLVFAMSRHHQGAADGRHLTSQASSHALNTATPAPVNTAPMKAAPMKAAPSEVVSAKAAPTHLHIVAAPPARAARAPARLDARPAVRAPAPRVMAAPSRLNIAPSTAPNPAPAPTVTGPAPTPAPSAAPEVSTPAPSLSTPAPQPTPEPAPAPSTAAPEAGGQATPQ